MKLPRRVLLALLVATGSAVCPALAEPADETLALAEAVREYSREATTPPFEYARADLNDDGILDAVVLLGDGWCGSGGCNMLILRGSPHRFTLLSSATIANQPIKVSSEVRYGWRTLVVWVKGGGSQPGFVLMRFNGARYPLNPTLQPRATREQVDSATALVFRKGVTR